jgi:acetyl-CoA C-acetyltransferase
VEPAAAVAVQGVAVEVSGGDATRSLPELIFACVRAALADAGCTMADVDAITIAAEDLIDGRSLSSMITGPAAGAYLRDEIRVSEDGLVALSLGSAQVLGGVAERVVVAAWGRASEGDPERSSAQGFDPFTTRPLNVTALTVSALRASAHLRRYGPQLAERALASESRQARARANPRASSIPVRTLTPPYPLHSSELRLEADAVAAVVLGCSPGRARITGVGHGTDSYHLGDRPLTDLPSAREATRIALLEASRSLQEVNVIEVGGRTMFDEVQLLESIGVAEPGGGFAALQADSRVNLSGGSAAGDCEPATGLVRFVEAVQQLTGRAGANQVAGEHQVALVVAGSALVGQSHTAVVVES